MALTLHKEWNTAPSGRDHDHLCKNRRLRARRLERLTAEARQQLMREVIGEAVDVMTRIERTLPAGGCVK